MDLLSIPELRGRRVLITGASNETGPHVAHAFASLGSDLALAYHQDKSSAEKVAAECRDRGAGNVHIFQLDLLDPKSCATLVPRVVHTLGGLDILIAVAGAGGSYTSLLQVESSELPTALQGQVCGNFLIARDAALRMPTDGSGRIVFVSAASSYKYSHGSYGFAKATLNELTLFLAYELASRKITVNTIVPQLIDLDSIPSELKEKRKRYTPLGNLPHPDQIAQMCVVLCSPLFDTVTGQLVYMDGGYRLRPPEDR
ncbi:MAG: SDR family oxidoreductase [Kiritimatiellae bacterium]|nr:SDR family oxidoreductase [Kiritimatiellia bacterium]